MNTRFKDFPRGCTEDQLLYLIWEELCGGADTGLRGFFNSRRRSFPSGLDRVDLLYLIWLQLRSGERRFTSRYEVSDITSMDPKVLDALECGDQVAKVTGKQRHVYIVTYKGEGSGEGICLSYFAAGYLETVSYDRSGNGWAYNSTDVVEVSSGGSSPGGEVMVVEGASEGGVFTADDDAVGDATYLAAKAAVADGAVVWLKYGSNMDLVVFADTGSDDDSLTSSQGLVWSGPDVEPAEVGE